MGLSVDTAMLDSIQVGVGLDAVVVVSSSYVDLSISTKVGLGVNDVVVVMLISTSTPPSVLKTGVRVCIRA